MAAYSVEFCKGLERQFTACQLDRPLRVERYDPGDRLDYQVSPISLIEKQPVQQTCLEVEKFVGGGFVGQVYKVRLLTIEKADASLVPGRSYALKILAPPSRSALFFRNLLYWIGFQGPFQLQVNPAAARAGALWQKFIRRAAAFRFGDERAVNDVHATLIDHTLGACGQLGAWVDGRNWRLEVDDRLDLLSRWERGAPVEEGLLGSLEYRSKKTFMAGFVALLHEMGAHEFARQYEWSTWKSQPNVLKRLESEADPQAGLTAIDFCAGLTLLPFLPMSPADLGLILQGFRRGSLVQFDRGDLSELRSFVQAHSAHFADMLPLLEELEECEAIYRHSIPDIAHHQLRLLSDRSIWRTMAASAVTGWRVQNLVDQPAEARLRRDKLFLLFFALLALLPFLGAAIRKFLGRPDYRSHYLKLFSGFAYVKRAVLGRRLESLIGWYREGRLSESSVSRVAGSFPLFLLHSPLSILPVGLHHFLSDWEFFRYRAYRIFIRPLRLYFNAALRKQWLQEMIADGQDQRLIGPQDAQAILAQLDDPYIHKYLKSLAVHVVLAPTTHVVSLGLAAFYLVTHPEVPRVQAYAVATGIVALFQVIPVSPGSLARGLYVLYLALRERNFREYSLALMLAFFKYIGYMAFPVQMAYRYPALARFMAGYAATSMVHVLPVFGESGALLEHRIFTLFYNLPLTLRRRMAEREVSRKLGRPRSWHALLIVLALAVIGALIENLLVSTPGSLPAIRQVAPALILSGLIAGILVNLGSGGTSSLKRLLLALVSGVGLGLVLALISFTVNPDLTLRPLMVLSHTVWRSFIVATVSALGAILAEFKV